MNPIEYAWNSYRAKVIPKDAGPIQVEETHRAFLAGMASMNNILDGIASLPEEQAILALSAAKEYLMHFAMGELAKAKGRSDA